MGDGILNKVHKLKESKYRDWVIGAFIVLVGLVGYLIYKSVSRPKTNPDAERTFVSSFLMYLRGRDTIKPVEGWKEVAFKYPNTIWGKRALYYLGFFYYTKGDVEKAREYFKDFLKSGLKDRWLRAGAFVNLAGCEAKLGGYRKASDYALKARDEIPYKALKGYFNYKAALYSKMAMDYKKALDILEDFDYRGHYLEGEVAKLKAELKSLMNVKG